MLDKIQTIFRDIFDDPSLTITEFTGPGDIAEWDSIAQIDLLVALENEFQVKFSMAESQQLKSVRDILDITSSKLPTP